MKQYLDLVRHVLEHGKESDDRTGTGTLAVFGYQNRYDLSKGFPLVTTKKVPFRLVAEELFWMLRGETNIKSLQDKKVHIWDEWADENGELGPVYGAQWRSWMVAPDPDYTDRKEAQTLDQIRNVIERIKTHPDCRRLIVTAWNPADIPDVKLPPCHCFFQFDVSNGKLSCQLYQRSADLFLGVPFNIASYALLTHLMAQECNLLVGDFIHTFGNAHIYKNHIEQMKLQLTRDPLPLPELAFAKHPIKVLDTKWEDLVLLNYNPLPKIKGAISV